MIRILVCERDQQIISGIRERLAALSVRYDVELDVYWLVGERMEAELIERVGSANLLLLSMRTDDLLPLARTARRLNAACRLVVYGGQAERLPGWLPAGPLDLCALDASLDRALIRLIEEVQQDEGLFHIRSRQETLHVPYGRILYFESDLKHVRMVCDSGDTNKFACKLDQIEASVGRAVFLRIHQSFLVNRRAILSLDHVSHEALLPGGVRLPVSRNYYAGIMEALAERA
jgi:DNA-binding LytR/AlgR family response regulator